MFHSLIMLDNCLFALAKNPNTLINLISIIQFLVLWYRIKKHYLGILAYLQSIIPINNDATFKLKWKTALKATQASIKMKYIDDLVVAKAAKITALRNQ